jgi:5'-methylthioadenosine phosphorylase
VLLNNAQSARGVICALAERVVHDGRAMQCGCRRALDHALITAPDARDPAMIERLRPIAGRRFHV